MVNIKSLISVALIGFSMQLSAQNVHVHGTVNGIKDGTPVLLMLSDGRSAMSIAYDSIRDGVFSLKATVEDGISIGYVLFDDRNLPSIKGREFYLAPDADIEVTFSDPKELRSYPIKSNVPEQAEFDRFIEKSRRQHEETVELFLSGLSHKETKEQRDSISAIIDANDIELLSEMPLSEVWIDKLTELAYINSIRVKTGGYNNLDALKTLYERIPDYLRDDTRIERIKTFLYPPKTVEIGDDYADAAMFDLEGNPHRLAEFAGKWILLDFWSRGCYPCIMALPELEAFSQVHPDDVAVVSISSDETEAWKDASKHHNITWHNWCDGKMDAGIYAVYGCEAIPTFVLISPEGKVTNKWAGFGAGMFERKLQSQIYQRKTPVYTKRNGRFSAEYPRCEKNATNDFLHISKIENTDKGVTLFFDAYSSPKYWAKIAPEAWVQTPEGKRYKVVTTEGITVGEEYYVGQDGHGAFSITFEPVPAGTTTLDFYESENPSDFHITGICLTE
ncbi:MAG: AhpC/TSA family protein [Muribaculaceae bacterium]|nr:AhpC/TSA family protein [Muribaculaceae bacterium]